VGRAPACDLPIDDASISRRHARFRVHGDRCRVLDLGGRNGTFVNGELVTEVEVRHGDTVVLGRLPLHVETIDAAALAVLSDEHAMLEPAGTLLRAVEPEGPTAAPPEVSSERLLHLLTEISRQLVQSRPLPEMLDRIATVALDSVPADRLYLLLVDEKTGSAVPHVVRARSGPAPAGATISRTIIRRTIKERLAMLAADARLDPGLAQAESVHAGNIRSFMSVPLWNQSAVIGVLYVDSPRSTPFSPADLDVLQALAAYAAVAIEQSRLAGRLLEEGRLRERLQRYHSAAVIDRILSHQGTADAPFMAEERDVTILFADIVGFTSIAEKMTPPEVAQMLNRCFAVLCDAVFAEQGTLDKFIGDAVLAVFGAPLNQGDHAMRAARAARAMRVALSGLDITPPLTLRIALNSGVATVGDIGSPQRREYTVLGDVVNTCSRLVSYACEPGQIVISGATRHRLPSTMKASRLEPVTLRGRAEPVELFELEPGR
jgi:adenylate cyclase